MLSTIIPFLVIIITFLVFVPISNRNAKPNNSAFSQQYIEKNSSSIHISTSHIENVDEIMCISAVSHYGTGLLTAIITFFVELLGIENTMLNDKIIKAEEKATYKLKQKAHSLCATGIMNFRVEISGLTVYVYGTAYRSQIDDIDEYDE